MKIFTCARAVSEAGNGPNQPIANTAQAIARTPVRIPTHPDRLFRSILIAHSG